MAGYGFEILRADGSIGLSTRETLLRLIHVETVSGDYSGTFSVPLFDAVESAGSFTGKGFFYVQVLPDILDAQILFAAPTIYNQLNWNNTTKEMTVVNDVPSPFRPASSYQIVFKHFR